MREALSSAEAQTTGWKLRAEEAVSRGLGYNTRTNMNNGNSLKYLKPPGTGDSGN